MLLLFGVIVSSKIALASFQLLKVFISFYKWQLPFKGQTANQATSLHWHVLMTLVWHTLMTWLSVQFLREMLNDAFTFNLCTAIC